MSFRSRKQPETIFKERVLEDLKTLGPHAWFEKIQQVAKRGTPDILLCYCGIFIAIELKKNSKEKPEPLQKHKLKRIIKAGGYAFVAHPDNWVEVFTEIKELGKYGLGN